ncbi:MAG: hypothetical protein M1834_003263 [Cirrosporium novae-zelandiae]|nr:MAG: hypothetical protein M1834_003263 [Cirrosporium novae-zelandiae]
MFTLLSLQKPRIKTVSNGDSSVKDDGELQAAMHFLTRDPLFDSEKPYSMRYPPQGDLPQSNIKREKHLLEIHNMRQRLDDLKFEQCGFGMMNMDSDMSYDDFNDGSKITSVYLQEIGEAMKRTLNAKHVYVIDYAVRRRHSEFPISTGKNYKYDQPTAMAHIDFTCDEGRRMLQVLYGDDADKVIQGRWQIIKYLSTVYDIEIDTENSSLQPNSAWRPLRGPLNDWPLGLCDAQSVDFANDTMAGDIVFRDWATENMQVRYNPMQKWYYLPDHIPSEVLIFKSADSEGDGANGELEIFNQHYLRIRYALTSKVCPHAGFFNPQVRKHELPRESIDCRAFVLYADLDEYPPEVGNLFQGHM